MFCLRRALYNIPPKIINGYPFESKRAINLIPKIFRKRQIRYPPDFDVKEYKAIYGFKLIPVLCGFSKRKYLYYGLCSLVVFGSAGFFYRGYIDEEQFQFLLLVGTLNMIMIALLTGLAKNVIGKVYVNKDFSKLIISYGNSSGARINTFYKPDHLIIGDHPNPIYRQFCKRITIKETDFHYNLCNFLTVKDELTFYKIFPFDS